MDEEVPDKPGGTAGEQMEQGEKCLKYIAKSQPVGGSDGGGKEK